MDRKAALSVLNSLLNDEELEILAEAAEMGLVREMSTYSDDDLVAIAQLSEFEQFHVLQNLVRTNRNNWMTNFARGLMESTRLADQREIDYKRGYWKGATFYTSIFPKAAVKKVAREAAKDLSRGE